MGITFIAVRHAQPESEGYADETLRRLSAEGVQTHYRITRMMKDEGVKPSQIYSSPIVRAYETAIIMGEIFELDVVKTEALGYDFNESILLKLLNSAKEGETIVMVGHEPFLAQFVNKLVGETILPRGLSKSSAAVLSFDRTVERQKAKLITIFQG